MLWAQGAEQYVFEEHWDSSIVKIKEMVPFPAEDACFLYFFFYNHTAPQQQQQSEPAEHNECKDRPKLPNKALQTEAAPRLLCDKSYRHCLQEPTNYTDPVYQRSWTRVRTRKSKQTERNHF